MLLGFVYSVVIIFACSLGSLTGMGGGVMIKPIFDAIGVHDVVSISFYSSVAVFTMSLISTVRQVKNGIQFHKKRVTITIIGSIVGG